MTPKVKEMNITEQVWNRLEELKDEGLALPTNYNAQNALKAAWLKLQSVKARDGQAALNFCTKPSIANTLLDMVVQGLSPAKNQCYFIVYGNELQMRRSYFGTIAALKRLQNVEDIDAQVVHQGDEFEIGADEVGHVIVTDFKPSFKNLDKPLIGVFAFIKLASGRTDYTIMTKKQIDTSWSQSIQHKVQAKFSDEMAKRTVLNRAAKMFINTSDDSDLLTGAINATTSNEYEDQNGRKDVTSQESTPAALMDKFHAAKKEVAEEPAEKPVEAAKPEADEEPKDAPKDSPVETIEATEKPMSDPNEAERQTDIYEYIEEEQTTNDQAN